MRPPRAVYRKYQKCRESGPGIRMACALIVVCVFSTAGCNGVQMGTHSAANPNVGANHTSAGGPGPAPRQGFVSIDFDDGYESAYLNGMPILDKAGIKTTQFIITQLIGHPLFLTQDQILTLQAEGHEIGAHTRTHPHLSTLTDDQQKNEILGSYDDLVAMGIRPNWFAYPYGDYNSISVTDARSTFEGARTVNGAANDKSTEPFLLNCYSIHPGAPVYAIGDITKLIDSAQTNGTWLILLFHKVDEDDGDSISVPHDLIQQVTDYLLARSVKVVTMSQGWSLISGTAAP